MKKVLIITYYWPPSGGAGVQRWLKFSKYLRGYGWEPVIYTPANPEMPVEDQSLEKDVPEGIVVLKTPIWEPYNLYKKFIGQKKEEKINTGFLSESRKPKLSEKISVWIRGNFFIPDARVFWVRPSVRFLSKWLRKHPVDVVVTTGPPHSLHLIGLKLKKEIGIKWVADFRDPWTNIDFYEDLMLSDLADRKHRRMEKAVLRNADCVLTVGQTMKEEFNEIGASRIEVITNGYDEADVVSKGIVLDKKFSLAHIGTLVKSRNPELLWNVLSSIVTENRQFASDLEIKLVGKVDVNVTESIEKAGLLPYVKKIDYLPHSEVTKVQQQSQVLLLLLNNTKNAKGILTGKFFEYLSARRPILCIGPEDGDAAMILRETFSGRVSDYKNYREIKKIILDYYYLYIKNELMVNSKGIEKFSRRELTGSLAKVFNDILD